MEIDSWTYIFKQDTLPARAAQFASDAHSQIGQVRKYTGEPYFNHPLAVAQLVMTVTDDEAVIAAALLHDTIEDTNVTLADIEKEFGAEIAQLVGDLTDISRPEDGDRQLRKEIDRQHTALADPRAKTVKLADVMHNSRSIIEHDKEYARIYLAEKGRLLEVLTEGHPVLYAQAHDVVFSGLASL